MLLSHDILLSLLSKQSLQNAVESNKQSPLKEGSWWHLHCKCQCLFYWQCSTTTSLIKELLSTAGSVCLAFSPVLNDARGNSLNRSGIKGAYVIYFSPSSEEEGCRQYKLALDTSFPSWVLEKTANILGMLKLLLSTANVNVAARNVQVDTSALKGGIKTERSYNSEWNLHNPCWPASCCRLWLQLAYSE